MKIILDENLPHYLKKVLSEHEVTTVYDRLPLIRQIESEILSAVASSTTGSYAIVAP